MMRNEAPSDGNTNKDTLAILTLRKHQDGIWIHRLVEALQKQQQQKKDPDGLPEILIQVVVLEDFLQGPFCVSSPPPEIIIDKDHLQVTAGTHWMGLVNRVSDAAEPWQVKACMAVMQIARLVWKIPIWNGPDAYSLCTHKWCHHVLFAQANLDSPHTVAALQTSSCANDDDGDTINEAKDDQLKAISSSRHDNPQLEVNAVNMLYQLSIEPGDQETKPATTPAMLNYLIKPNAGGFGAGIERRQVKMMDEQNHAGDPRNHTPTSSTIATVQERPIPNYSDRFVLFQNYVQPKDGKIFRVWFLMGKVQCAVERTVEIPPLLEASTTTTTTTSTEEFTSGCVGGVCQRQPKNARPMIQPWSVPEDVRREMEEQLLPVLPPDAHCGSVEFLLAEEPSKSEETTNKLVTTYKRLYFDLNLLSTLPVEEDQQTPDPWLQLASAIWTFVRQ
ncbi:expressed unknown protein [Seminavis robusta]|uniref:Uncharacterized protein n=1 Tax=Seminavis robusta TaxID=568900 RepID=A0A9N8F2G5_9STRA|nr:expressed unknown protein [Seminavis robusta]|eukprot:Sro2842_g338260.1 n/a (446) ;mRNA; r:2371-3708